MAAVNPIIISDKLNPFSIFPEEIWGLIIDQLGNNDRSTILNLLEAYPQLDLAFQKKKYLWKLDQVLEHLLPYLSEPRYNWTTVCSPDILSLRQVSSFWLSQVDSFLLSTSSPDPSSSSDEVKGHQNHPFRSQYFLRPLQFKDPDTILEFLQTLPTFPIKRPYPFFTHSVSFQASNYEPHGDDIWDEAYLFCRTFKSHLHSVEFSTNHNDDPLDFSKAILKCLRQLPNLKILTLNGYFSKWFGCPYDPAEIRREISPAKFRKLPNLTELRIIPADEDQVPEPLINLLFQAYSPQIKKLTVPYKQWKRYCSKIFPNLEEFTIEKVKKKKILHKMLQFLHAPNLKVLNISKDNFSREEENRFVFEDDLLPFLGKFEKLERFSIKDSSLEERGNLDGENELNLIKNLKSIEISTVNEALGYNFLLAFPNLEEIKLNGNSCWRWTVNLGQSRDNLGNSKLKIKRELESGKLFESNVWQLFPKLKRIKVDNRKNGNGKLIFTRDEYNYWEKVKNNDKKE